jgi:pseudoazurin
MEITRKLLMLVIFIISIPVNAADHTIEMLSSSNGQMMVFKPAVLKINSGDTVTWKATNPGHNTASIEQMSADPALKWNGKINEELKITFTKEGVYGYKCTPHYILGMVGVISVGKNLDNLSASTDFAIAEEKKFATNKDRFSNYMNELKN